jgi:hypothetical protein
MILGFIDGLGAKVWKKVIGYRLNVKAQRTTAFLTRNNENFSLFSLP